MADNNSQVSELCRQLMAGLHEYMQGDEYTKYLDVMSKFPEYSYRNTALIAMQKPDATHVMGYNAFKKIGRQVIKGAKAIKIIAPIFIKDKKDKTPDNEENKDEELKNPDGTAVSDKNSKAFVKFRAVNVFDISQTTGEPLPEITVHDLTDPVKDFDNFMEIIKSVSPVPIHYGAMPIGSTARGYYDSENKEIVLRKGMPEEQTLKTALHELTHSILHDRNLSGRVIDQQTREIEAESTAYVICKHFGFDTGDYSFPYISAWSQDTDLQKLNESMTVIQKTAEGVISGIEKGLELDKAREAILDVYKDNPPDMSDLQHIDLLFTHEDGAKQYSADLVNKCINVYDVKDYLNYKLELSNKPADKYGNLIESRQYDDINELINKGIPDMNKSATEHTETAKENAQETADKEKRTIGNIVYVPVYDGDWKVQELLLDKCKFWGKNDIVYNGKIYSNEVYASEKGAWDYINRNNNDGFKERIEFEPDTHKPYFTAERFAEQREARERNNDIKIGFKPADKENKAEKKHSGPEL